MQIELISDSAGIVIKHVSALDNANKKLCFIFGERFFDASKLGGAEIFFRNGYDVILIYDAKNAWYQYLDDSMLVTVNKIYADGEYEERIAYGISMGGYAAVQFSSILKYSMVIAFSPQFSIAIEADTRHYAISQTIEMRYAIGPESIQPSCVYHFISDHTQKLDKMHIDRFGQLIDNNWSHYYNVKYTGHSTVKSLSERGILKETLVRFMKNESVAPNFFKRNRRTSKTYLTYLAGALSEHGKNRFARIVLDEAIERWPGDHLLLKQKGIALRRSNEPVLACEALHQSLQYEANDCDTFIQLSISYEGAKSLDDAIAYAQQAIAIDSGRAWYHKHLDRLLAKA